MVRHSVFVVGGSLFTVAVTPDCEFTPRLAAASRSLLYTLLWLRHPGMPVAMALLVSAAATAWMPNQLPPGTFARSALGCHPQRRTNGVQLCAPNEEDSLDFLVIYGDARVLLAYGCVQALFDLLERPVTAVKPGIFLPVPHAPSQAIILAAVWVGLTLVLDGYSLRVTRGATSQTAALKKALIAGLCASGILVSLALSRADPGLTLEAELDFIMGSTTALCGWRFLFMSAGPIV